MTPEPITSLANPLVKRLRSYHQRKFRDADGMFVVEGLRALIEGLEVGWTPELVVVGPEVDGPAWRKAQALLPATVRVQPVTLPILEKIARRDNPQTVLATFRQRWEALEALSLDPSLSGGGLWVALDRVRDPGNLGTIIRTVDAVAGRGLILLDACCDPYGWETVRATMGSLFSVPLVRADTQTFLDWRRAQAAGPELAVIGTSLKADEAATLPRARSTLLLMGNEQQGLTAALEAACTDLTRLPMRGRADSLNLAVATGVMLYKLIA